MKTKKIGSALRYVAAACLMTMMLSGCQVLKQNVRDFLLSEPSVPAVPPLSGPALEVPVKFRLYSLGETLRLSAHAEDGSAVSWLVVSRPEGSTAEPIIAASAEVSFTPDQSGDYVLGVSAGRNSEKVYLYSDATHAPRVRFVAIGDQGKANSGQQQVADAIEKHCLEANCDFVVGLGDNIYPKGPDSVDDPQFQSAFEQPYKNINLPFYMVLGNHDTSGNFAGSGVFNLRGEIEVAYTQKSKKWRMPYRYYQLSAPFTTEREPLLNIYALDSAAMTAPFDPVWEWQLSRMVKRQGQWFDASRRNSHAQWHISMQHHPYLSGGEHGNAGNYNGLEAWEKGEVTRRLLGVHVKEFYEQWLCNRVDFHLSGHDHDLEWLQPTSACPRSELIVSGGGGSNTPLRNRDHNPVRWQASARGFFWFDVTPEQIQVKAFTVPEDGSPATEAYSYTVARMGM